MVVEIEFALVVANFEFDWVGAIAEITATCCQLLVSTVLKLHVKIHVCKKHVICFKDMDLDLAYFPSGGTHKRVVLA